MRYNFKSEKNRKRLFDYHVNRFMEEKFQRIEREMLTDRDKSTILSDYDKFAAFEIFPNFSLLMERHS